MRPIVVPRHVRLVVSGALLLLALGACFDLDQFRGITFKLPQKTIVVDATSPALKVPPGGGANIPAVPCTDAATSCCTPAAAAGLSCAEFPLACQTSRCVLPLDVEQAQTVDLKKEEPRLANLNADLLTDVLLKSLDYQVQNGLNVALPSVDLFVAPAGVTSAADARAKKLVTLPGASAGAMTTQKVPLSSEAQQTFSQYAKAYKTPFVLIAKTQVVIGPGQPAPTGKAEIKVSGDVEARF